MVIIGYSTSTIDTKLMEVACGNCKSTNTYHLSILQRYVHLFWIPLFSLGKTALVRCQNCKQLLIEKEFTPALQQAYFQTKNQTKTPKWTFAGILLFVLFSIIGIVYNQFDKADNLAHIQNPLKGDVYEIKNKFRQYTLYKVQYVKGDTVFVVKSEIETNKLKGLRELKSRGDEIYNKQPTPIIKSELQALLNKGNIMDIERKNTR